MMAPGMIAVGCPRCDLTLEVTPEMAECAVLFLHTQERHRNHGLTIKEENEVRDLARLGDVLREVAIEVRCINCGGNWTSATVPACLVGAWVMAFHSHHEGHPLAFRYEGKQLWPFEEK